MAKPGLSPSTSEVERVLAQLERAIRWSSEFQLLFVKCNHPHQQAILRQALITRLHDMRVLEVEVEQPIVSLLDVLAARWNAAAPPQVVCVYHLERSINAQQEASPVLGRLNHDRDLLRRAMPAAILLWLPDFALDCLARGAPDFWAWRSGVYEFPTNRGLWHGESMATLAPEALALRSLPLQDKQQEMAHVSELLRTACSLSRQDKRGHQIVANLLTQLAQLHDSLGDWEKAQACLEEALTLFRQFGDEWAIARTYNNLGIIAHERGAYEQALGWSQQALALAEKQDDRASLASSYLLLGTIAHEQGAYEEALRWYRRALAIEEALGDEGGLATLYHQLGMLAHDRGAYEEALEQYRQALALDEKLGDRPGTAASSSQIGVLYTTSGTPDAAVPWNVRSWLIRTALHSPDVRIDLSWLTQQRQMLGEGRFLGLLHEQLNDDDVQTLLRQLDEFSSSARSS